MAKICIRKHTLRGSLKGIAIGHLLVLFLLALLAVPQMFAQSKAEPISRTYRVTLTLKSGIRRDVAAVSPPRGKVSRFVPFPLLTGGPRSVTEVIILSSNSQRVAVPDLLATLTQSR